MRCEHNIHLRSVSCLPRLNLLCAAFASTAVSPSVNWLEELARPVALLFVCEWAAASAIFLAVTQLGIVACCHNFYPTRTSTNIYRLCPCLLRLQNALTTLSATASRNHSWFAEMARPAMLCIGGESAFAFVVVQATLHRHVEHRQFPGPSREETKHAPPRPSPPAPSPFPSLSERRASHPQRLCNSNLHSFASKMLFRTPNTWERLRAKCRLSS